MGARERSGRKAQIQKLRQFEEIRSTFFSGAYSVRGELFRPRPPGQKFEPFLKHLFLSAVRGAPKKLQFCRRRVSILWRDIDKAYVLLGAINREPDGPIKNG